MTPEISQIAQMGVAGLAVYFMYKISSNHIDHNTKILGELKDVIIKLTEYLENHK